MVEDVIPDNRRAPPGMIWRCGACGKEAVDLYGMIGSRSQGWDESCMLNATPEPADAETPNNSGDQDHDARDATPFADAIAIVEAWYSPVELSQWLQTPQPLIDNKTPLALLAAGRIAELLNVVKALDEGAYL